MIYFIVDLKCTETSQILLQHKYIRCFLYIKYEYIKFKLTKLSIKIGFYINKKQAYYSTVSKTSHNWDNGGTHSRYGGKYL